MNTRPIPDSPLAAAWPAINADIERWHERSRPALIASGPVPRSPEDKIAALKIGEAVTVYAVAAPAGFIAAARRKVPDGAWRAKWLGDNAWRVTRVALTDLRRSHNTTYHAKSGQALGDDNRVARERSERITREADYVRACNARGGFDAEGNPPYAYGATWRGRVT